ncbi:hypothetical protein [Sphingomonas sp. BAUL-RG-20F-R05-02]|uniref:hypothetical protein n=1 Tax=Sphingomonas sp. BAUL-RG-20F-R05-02 TaxID=2914830 RepID=UPI001F58858A|nr:hypothetical protein [Sphingomonas sp. BAUL-RG-20F-R05-02]
MADVLKTRDMVRLRPRPTLREIRGGGFRVSTTSLWRESVWRLDSEQDGLVAHTFDFRRTPSRYRNTAKMWIWLAIGGVGAVAPMRISTMASTPERLASGFAFMQRFANRPDRLIPAHFALLVDALKEGYPIGPNGGGPPEQPIRGQLGIWRDLWHQRDAFAAAGMAELRFDPFAVEGFGEVIASFGCREHGRRPPLPDEVAALLFVSSERHLEFGQDVASLQTRILNLLAENGGTPPPELLTEVRRGPYRAIGGRPWHMVPGSVDTPAKAVIHVRWLIGLIEGAMAHLIFHEIGLRPSEYVSPVAGYDEDTGLPRCVEAVSVPDQGLVLYLLHGTLFKHKEQPQPNVWAMGVTPIGAALPPPSVRAIELIDWMHTPWRGDCDKLQVRFNLHPDPKLRSKPCDGMTLNKVRKHLKRFYSQVDWPVLQLTDAQVAAIVKEKGDEIVPTNMRKSLTNYFMRLDERLLGPLSVQLKHDSEDETDVDYVMNDPTMLEPAREFASREVARIMLQLSRAVPSVAAAELPATHLPHLADVAALHAAAEPSELLEAVNRIVLERSLSRPRQTVGQSVVPSRSDRADALLEQYRVVRPIWLTAITVGRRREYDSFRVRSERIAGRLAELGIDPPTDKELRSGDHG